MKSLKEYLLEEKEEPIDEGLKDWIKKAACTAAVAAACLNLAAAPKENTNDIHQPDKEKIEQVKQNNTNATKQLTSKIVKNDDGSFTLTSIPSRSDDLAVSLFQKLNVVIMKDYPNAKIKDFKKLYNPTAKLYAYSITIIIEK